MKKSVKYQLPRTVKYRTVDEKKKHIKLIYKKDSIVFELKQRRSFVVLREIVKRHPEFMNIHDLDDVYHDPNRALSDLRNTDGFQHFLIETSIKNVTHVSLDINKLFATIPKKSDIVKLYPHDNREGISIPKRRKIFKQFEGKCNITGIELKHEDEFDDQQIFMKTSQIATYDHRKPLVKTGVNQDYNFQLLSRIVNQEKNKICNICIDSKCDICALAHPERSKIIYPTGQDISTLQRDGD